MTFQELKIEAEKRNIILTDEMLEQLKMYADLLVEWNEKFNLTAITEIEEIIEKHFYDSLLMNIYLKDKTSIADVGSGAGFPGMVLAIANKDKNFTLIEPTGKRCTFLEEVKKQLHLSNVTIVNKRAEDCVKIYREIFDVVTARAVANLPVLAELCIPLVKVGGCFVSMKGSQGKEEAVTARYAFQVLGSKEPIVKEDQLTNGDERVFVIGEKEKSTPNKYPRAFGQIKKKPLLKE